MAESFLTFLQVSNASFQLSLTSLFISLFRSGFIFFRSFFTIAFFLVSRPSFLKAVSVFRGYLFYPYFFLIKNSYAEMLNLSGVHLISSNLLVTHVY